MALYNPSNSGQQPTTIAAPTLVPVATTSTKLLDANSNRLGATIANSSFLSTLYVCLTATATKKLYWVKLAPQGYTEIPYGYMGVVSGIWDKLDAAADVGAIVHDFYA